MRSKVSDEIDAALEEGVASFYTPATFKKAGEAMAAALGWKMHGVTKSKRKIMDGSVESFFGVKFYPNDPHEQASAELMASMAEYRGATEYTATFVTFRAENGGHTNVVGSDKLDSFKELTNWVTMVTSQQKAKAG